MWNGSLPGIEGGWQRTVPLRDRVNLYYILEHRQVTDTYLNNRGDPRRRRAIAQAVREFYGDAPFIWSVGESQKETGDFACLPTDVEGRGRQLPSSLPHAQGERHQRLQGRPRGGMAGYNQAALHAAGNHRATVGQDRTRSVWR